MVGENEPFELGDTLVTPIPLDAENAHAFLFEGDGKRVLVAMDETHGWTPPDARAARPRRAPDRRLRAPPLHRRAADPGGVLQAAGQEDALRPDARAGARARRRGARSSRTSRRWTGSRTTSSSGSARPTAGSPRSTASSSMLDGGSAPAIRLGAQVGSTRRLSQRISEGDGIAIIVRVGDAEAARAAQEQGAKALAVDHAIDGIRDSSTLPVLWLARRGPGRCDADAVAIRPTDDDAEGLETVIEVRDEDELEEVLEVRDPEIVLISPRENGTGSARAGARAAAGRSRPGSSRSPTSTSATATRCCSSSAPASTRCSSRPGHVGSLVGTRRPTSSRRAARPAPDRCGSTGTKSDTNPPLTGH